MLDGLTESGHLKRATYVFVSTIDPESQKDFRNEYFFCNEQYVHFFEEELIPGIEQFPDARRNLIGVSFGRLNAAYFAAQTNAFDGYALLSPITYPCERLNKELIFSSFENYKVYISTGKRDAETYVDGLYLVLQSKTSQIRVVRTEGAHDFENWNNQIREVVNFLGN